MLTSLARYFGRKKTSKQRPKVGQASREPKDVQVLDRGSKKIQTFSKNSPVSSSSPGSRARMKDFVIGRRLACNGK